MKYSRSYQKERINFAREMIVAESRFIAAMQQKRGATQASVDGLGFLIESNQEESKSLLYA